MVSEIFMNLQWINFIKPNSDLPDISKAAFMGISCLKYSVEWEAYLFEMNDPIRARNDCSTV